MEEEEGVEGAEKPAADALEKEEEEEEEAGGPVVPSCWDRRMLPLLLPLSLASSSRSGGDDVANPRRTGWRAPPLLPSLRRV